MDIPGTSTATDAYNQWSQVIECPICYSIYDKPMQMGCGHTICATCVGRLVDQVKNTVVEIPPQMPQFFDDRNNPIFGLGGNQNEIEEAIANNWIEVPRLDHREPHLRGILPLNQPRRRDNGGSTEIKCPECRKPTVVPADGQLPVNYRVQEIVQKVAPMFKDRHLVKHCTQCTDILAGGLYFECETCREENQKICSVCSIRKHNGHTLVEKKALTSEDVRNMKQKINDASARAFQAFEGIKPRVSRIGGSVETRVNEKLSSLIKIFEFMISTFDTKIKETSTVDELMVEVQKAEQIATVYEQGQERMEEMIRSIEQAFGTFWDPFEALKQEMEFDTEPPVEAPPPTPAVVAPPPIHHVIPQHIMDQLEQFGAGRPRQRPVGHHHAQVDRMRQRQRNPGAPAPPMQGQGQFQQRVGPPHAGQIINQGFPWAAHMGHGMMHIPPQFRAHRGQQQQQGPQQPPPMNMQNIPNFGPEIMELLQGQLRVNPGPGPARLNERNLQQHQQQHQHQHQNQNVPLPPQMPNFPVMPMHPHPQQQLPPPPQQQQQRQLMPPHPQHQQQIRFHPAGPQQQPQNQRQMYFPGHPQQFNMIMPIQVQHQQQQHLQPQVQQQMQQQQPPQPPMQILQQQIQMPELNQFPEPEPVAEMVEPQVEQEWADQQQFGLEAEEGVEDVDEEQRFVQDAEIAAVHALEMIRVVPVNADGQPPLEQDMIVEPDDVADEEQQFEDARAGFGFQEVQQVVDALAPPEYRPERNLPIEAPFPEEELADAREEFQEEEDVQEVPRGRQPAVVEIEEDEEEEEEEDDDVIYQPPENQQQQRQQRDLTVDDADNRRQTRRSLRNSLPPEEGPSTSAERTSSSPSSSASKRRRVDKSRGRAEPPEPEPMDAEENSLDATPNRPPKRRAATSSNSGASTSGASSSAPTTRSQTRT